MCEMKVVDMHLYNSIQQHKTIRHPGHIFSSIYIISFSYPFYIEKELSHFFWKTSSHKKQYAL